MKAVIVTSLYIASACNSQPTPSGTTSRPTAHGVTRVAAGAGARIATPSLCKRMDAVAGDSHLNILSLSLHHGTADGGVPHRSEIESTAKELSERITDVDDLLIVIPAAPYPPDLTRLRSTGEELFGLLKDKYHWNVSYRQTNATALDWNNSAVIAGSGWTITDAKIRDYRGAGVYNYDSFWGAPIPPDGVEGPHFGDFTIAGVGTTFHVLTLQTNCCDDEKKARQIEHLIDYGEQVGGGEPAFIIGDYNLTRNDSFSTRIELAFNKLTAHAHLMTWCSEACANLPGKNAYPDGASKIHIAQLNGPTRLAPFAWLVDKSSGSAFDTVFHFSGIVHYSVAVALSIQGNAAGYPSTCSSNCPEGKVACNGSCVALGTKKHCQHCGDTCSSDSRCESAERGCVFVGGCAPGIECSCSPTGCAASTAQCHTFCLHNPP